MDAAGLGVIVWLNAGLFALAALVTLHVPDRLAGSSTAPTPVIGGLGPWRALLGIPVFARLMAVAALVGGSPALHDGFEVADSDDLGR